MDEFVKVSPNKRKLLEMIETMSIDEGMEIVKDRDGSPDSYFIKITKKTIITRKI
jgi:hypothetical protein